MTVWMALDRQLPVGTAHAHGARFTGPHGLPDELTQARDVGDADRQPLRVSAVSIDQVS
jgi:hypothetical protein